LELQPLNNCTVAAVSSLREAPPRHSLLVRLTHWINAASSIAFILSGTAIFLAYPRLHWGETGTVGIPASIEFPLPFVLELGIRGPGRYLHFLTAWICLGNGLIYLVSGFSTGHFRRDLLPRRSDLTWPALRQVIINHLRLRGAHAEALDSYNAIQRLTYLLVIFILMPFMFFTGLAMSPAVMSVTPLPVDILGGQQSARTWHFFAATALVLFLIVHFGLVIVTGFAARMRAMITGHNTPPSRS
jgi:thiosulfate reductase cytochrome b subunit